MAKSRRLLAQEKIRRTYEHFDNCTTKEGACMWLEEIMGMVEIYKIMTNDERSVPELGAAIREDRVDDFEFHEYYQSGAYTYNHKRAWKD